MEFLNKFYHFTNIYPQMSYKYQLLKFNPCDDYCNKIVSTHDTVEEVIEAAKLRVRNSIRSYAWYFKFTADQYNNMFNHGVPFVKIAEQYKGEDEIYISRISNTS
jgi:hypothetical protein